MAACDKSELERVREIMSAAGFEASDKAGTGWRAMWSPVRWDAVAVKHETWGSGDPGWARRQQEMLGPYTDALTGSGLRVQRRDRFDLWLTVTDPATAEVRF